MRKFEERFVNHDTDSCCSVTPEISNLGHALSINIRGPYQVHEDERLDSYYCGLQLTLQNFAGIQCNG